MEVQGFAGLTDGQIPWLRFTPAMNFVFTLMGTILGSPALLLFTAALMAIGVLLPFHPWDLLYDRALRPLIGAPGLPVAGWRRRVTFSIGVPWLLATAWCFRTGRATVGYALGGLMAAFILVLATVQYCVISEILDRLFASNGRGSCATYRDGREQNEGTAKGGAGF